MSELINKTNTNTSEDYFDFLVFIINALIFKIVNPSIKIKAMAVNNRAVP